ncbi:PLP-dependent aminotransferase family protein [Pseudomonas sp. CC120222-01a]|uniref:aminotransferase-like domain-containing protein n=1 Tax=Pseudomonas sp. CC120222-01a TaxID=1378075 RepID=UPI000D8750C7|nr:PLP-dependent aminotransferase family protein [Pseudomonas sp. CC120222-01a]PVZ36896.1 DNA-binding transcriptional MocR family regulator [Pseudomonas sp. CC120222-01a]
MQRFRALAELLRKRIDAGLLVPGDKLPSLRRLASETGCSVVTVYRAYELLESQGLCQSRDRSGFYLCDTGKASFHRFAQDMPVMPADNVRALDESLARPHFYAQASAATLPADDCVDSEGLNKLLRRALLQTQPSPPHAADGHPALVAALLQRAGRRDLYHEPEQVIVTRSAMESFNLCLDSLRQSCAPVLVESPSFHPILESLRHRGIKALEIYSHPQQGIDPEQFEHILKSTDVKLCVLMGCNRFPTGVTYSRDTLGRLVAAARRHEAIIIENDMTAELGYGELRSPSLGEFDSDGRVVQFGGTTSYLSSAFEIGWVMAARHAPQLSANRHLGATHLPHPAIQGALAEYLKGRKIERDMRATCRKLIQRMDQGIALLKDMSAGKVAVSAPDGGYMCWLRGPRGFDSMKLAMTATRNTFAFIPGPFFSPAGAFSNFMALNFSAPWTPERIAQLRRLMDRVYGQQE